MTSKRDLQRQIDDLVVQRERLQSRVRVRDETIERLTRESIAAGRDRDQYQQWWEKEREYRVRQNDRGPAVNVPRPHDPKPPWEKLIQGGYSPNTRASEETHSPTNWYETYRSARRRELAAYEREENLRRDVERLENENRDVKKNLARALAEYNRLAEANEQIYKTALQRADDKERLERKVLRLMADNADLCDALEQAGLRPPVARPSSDNPCAEVSPRTPSGMLQAEVTATWDAGYAVGYRHGSTP
jgi:hypothetical protein